MMKRVGEHIGVFLIIALVASLSPWAGVSFGYYVKLTHRLINNAISDHSVMDEYFSGELLRPLGADGRIADKYQGRSPYLLFEDGGAAEDGRPLYFRAWNHYHDPTKVWEAAGYTNPVLPNGLSSVLWAQYNRHPSPPLLISGANEWTWDAACQFFLGGLTGQDEATRDQNLGNLFSTLGRLTHLVGDMSASTHARNDGHLLYNYEDWCEANLKGLSSTAVGKEAFRYEFAPDNAVFAQSQPRFLPADVPLSPISNLWDVNAPATANPAAEWARLVQSPTTVGLAEYTGYVYPRREDVGLSLVPRAAKDGQTDYLLYFNRTTSDGIPVQHLAATDLVFLDQQAPLDISLRYVAAPSRSQLLRGLRLQSRSPGGVVREGAGLKPTFRCVVLRPTA